MIFSCEWQKHETPDCRSKGGSTDVCLGMVTSSGVSEFNMFEMSVHVLKEDCNRNFLCCSLGSWPKASTGTLLQCAVLQKDDIQACPPRVPFILSMIGGPKLQTRQA